MVELYFLFYRIPRMMSRLARERHQSALRWSLLGIAAWIGAEFLVYIGLLVLYGFFSLMLGGEDSMPTGVRFIAYILSLLAAITAVTIVQRLLTKQDHDRWPTPPSPPHFDQAA